MAAVLCIIEIRANEFTINQRYWDRSLINSKVVLPTGHLCSTYTCIDMHVCESMCAPHLWKLKIDLTPKALALKSLCVSKWWINKKLSPVQRDYIINNCDVINWFCHRLAWIVIKWRRQLSLMISLLITMSVVRQKTKKKIKSQNCAFCCMECDIYAYIQMWGGLCMYSISISTYTVCL